MVDRNDLIKRLITITGISSPYAPVPGCNYENNSIKMFAEIKSIEDSIQSYSSILHYHLAIAYRNYSTWYVRGNDRQTFLQKMVYHLEQAILLDENDFNSKSELAHILIEETLIRDLDKALIIVKELKEIGALPQWMNSIVEKAKRWKGDIVRPRNNDFSKLDPTPAVLREERTKLRKLLVNSLKAKDNETEIIAMRLYNLGLLVAYLYDSHDCNSGVMGMVYDNASKLMKKVAKKFNFEYLGKIKDAGFLTDLDYKRIEKVFGEKTDEITIDEIKGMI